MKVLIVVAGRHGATAEIGANIAEVLRGSGIATTVVDASSGTDPSGYDGVVMGSGVYFGRWLPAARRYLRTFRAALLTIPLWTFASGPVDRPHVASPASPVPDFLLAVSPVEHVTFGGRIESGSLNRLETIVVSAVRARDVDYRDPAQITRWARKIASTLTGVPQPGTVFGGHEEGQSA